MADLTWSVTNPTQVPDGPHYAILFFSTLADTRIAEYRVSKDRDTWELADTRIAEYRVFKDRDTWEAEVLKLHAGQGPWAGRSFVALSGCCKPEIRTTVHTRPED